MHAPAFPLHRKIISLIVLFLLIGEIMLFSATGVLGLQKHGSEFYYVIRQSACAIVGLALMIVLSRINYRKWANYSYFLLTIQILLMAATMVAGIGHFAMGAGRWIHLGPIAFQPSELAKVTVTIYVAHILTLRHSTPFNLKRWATFSLPVLGLLFLIFRGPDLGTTILLVAVMIGLFFISGAPLLYIVGFLGTGVGAALFAMLHSEYRRRRVFAYLNPWADPQGNGFQTIQSFLSIHSGKLFGVGLGNGNSKLFFLPEVHTDFIYSLTCEELGFVGAIVVLALFIYFTYLLFKVAFQAKEPFGCYLAFGLALSVILQIAVNLGGVTGIIPIKGLPLPFISWGRSALIVNLGMMGIVLNIVRQSGIIQKPIAEG